MTWFKVDDGLHSHPKWLAAPVGARSLWVTAGSWCAANLTDGRVPRHVLRMLGGSPRNAAELVRVGLWHTEGDGWRFHGWDEFQPSKASVIAERESNRRRQALHRDPDLRAAIIDRDKDECRYCGQRVTWAKGRKTATSGSIDHVIPPSQGGNETLDNLVTACNACNARKGSRTPEQARMTLRNAPVTHDEQFRATAPTRPDPTRPTNNVKGGDNSQAAAPTGPPPRRCAQHTTTDNPPPCGACAEARRTHIAWLAEHSQPHTPDPQAATQAAARARADRHLRVANGEACQACDDTGFTLDEDGTAVECRHT